VNPVALSFLPFPDPEISKRYASHQFCEFPYVLPDLRGKAEQPEASTLTLMSAP
jgi:hypothetical protein